jgi:hypothetical protein
MKVLCFGLKPVVLCVAALVGSAQLALAANFPLEITNIKPAGTGGLSANHRIFRAYPGVLYNIRAAVIGGAYPFVYSLTTAPSGMTINAQTGEINWPDPQATASATIRVQDREGTVVTSTWTINVTTNGFKFLDATNGRNAAANNCSSNCGTGTLANPWRTIRDMYTSTNGSGDILYFKSGTYNVLDLPRSEVGSGWDRVEFEEANKSVIWLAYPGQSPIIDFGYQEGVEWGPMIRLTGNTVYIDGFETRRSHIMGFQFPSGGNGPTFRRLRMHDHGPGVSGSNASMIMTTRGDASNMVIQNCEFRQSQDVMIKIYSQRKLLIEDNVFRDTTDALELKDSATQFTVRGNTFYNVSDMAIGGNMATDTGPFNGEITFNNVRANTIALDVNQNSLAGEIFVQRNTFVGRVQVRRAITSNGPFRFSNNVIISGDSGTPSGSHIYYSSVTDLTRIIQSNNLGRYPSDNAVDSAGNLTAAYANYVGTHGHMLGSGTGSTGISPPQGVRIVSSN